MEANIVKRGEYSLSNKNYHRQVDLLQRFGLSDLSYETHYVKVGKTAEGKEQLTLCKRSVPLKVIDVDSDNIRVAVNMKSISEQVGFSSPGRGKYNDEWRLGDLGNVEIGEVEPWSGI